MDLDEFYFSWSFCGGTINNRSFFFAKLAQPSVWYALRPLAVRLFLG
jgi:hypothetical protein